MRLEGWPESESEPELMDPARSDFPKPGKGRESKGGGAENSATSESHKVCGRDCEAKSEGTQREGL